MVGLDDVRIGFVGFGSMAQAMADGWIRSGVVPAGRLHACAARADALPARTDPRGMVAHADAAELVDAVDLVVVAVKPHLVEGVLAPLAASLAGRVVLSVAAGWSCADYERVVPGTHHVSTVPNTPVAICEGVIAREAADTLSDGERDLVGALLSALGEVVEVDTRLLSVAGTVGGCSPAFVAMAIEALADAAVKHGIPRATAYRMVSQVFAGTAKLQLETGSHPGAMKDAVCSPGGTTIRGVAELEAAGLRSALIRAIDAIEG